jgi:hypothetical protein
MEVSGQLHTSVIITPGEGDRCPRDCLDAVEMRDVFPLPKTNPRFFDLPARSLLSY